MDEKIKIKIKIKVGKFELDPNLAMFKPNP
jgi:hypothetical protein